MPGILRRGMTCLLLGIMPFYTSTAVFFDLLGPAHVHHHHEGEDHAHDHGHAHAHADVARHHHSPGDPSVVTVGEHAAPGIPARESGGTSGWSATMCAALVSHRASPHPLLMRDAIVPEEAARWQSLPPERPERPPPVSLA